MKESELDKYDNHPYVMYCTECGQKHEVRTQSNGSAEYMTDIYIKCSCGDFVKFELPVN